MAYDGARHSSSYSQHWHMNMSDQRHAKTVVPRLHLARIEDPTIIPE
jgi:hypothetical protein